MDQTVVVQNYLSNAFKKDSQLFLLAGMSIDVVVAYIQILKL